MTASTRPTRPAPDDDGIVDLARDAVEEVRDLVRIEIALARHDLARQLGAARAAAVAFGLAAGAVVVGAALLLVAVAAAFAPLWFSALIVGVATLVVGAPLGYVGWRALPKKPLAPTVHRVASDVEQVKERVA